MPYLEPKFDEHERAKLLKLVMQYAEINSDESGQVFLEILKFVERMMYEVYCFNQD